jgi:hypothetical protein
VGVLQSSCPVSDHFRTDAMASRRTTNKTDATDVHREAQISLTETLILADDDLLTIGFRGVGTFSKSSGLSSESATAQN